MGSVLFKVSDLTGEIVQPEQEDRLTSLVVEQHPGFDEPITLEALPEDIEGALPEPTQLVLLSYNSQQYLMPVEQFENLFRNQDAQAVLERAEAAQQEAAQEAARSTQRRQRRQRINWASAERAGEPHRGTISEAEKAYVREHLDEVNERLRSQGIREIDPRDPEMAERYGLTPASTGSG